MSSVSGARRPQDRPVEAIVFDQQVALEAAAVRLVDEFDGRVGPTTVERFLTSSYQELVPTATVPTYLPLLAERFARQRLLAWVKVEGLQRDGKPVVLFLCAHNAGRSQMALGFFTRHAGATAVAWSGGGSPATEVNPAAVAAMSERGLDLSTEYPKPWTDEVLRAADVVVTMGCGDTCPVLPGKRYEDWPVDDPDGLGLADVRAIRDDVERRVVALVESLQQGAGR